jgi:hypothetical protein
VLIHYSKSLVKSIQGVYIPLVSEVKLIENRGYSADDAEKITIPHIVLASKGEDAAVTEKYAEILSGKGKIGEVETYGTMHHGWMGARANLKDEDNLKEYERG